MHSLPTKTLMCWRTCPCSSTMRSRNAGCIPHSDSSASATVAGLAFTVTELRSPAKGARYVGMRKVTAISGAFIDVIADDDLYQGTTSVVPSGPSVRVKALRAKPLLAAAG